MTGLLHRLAILEQVLVEGLRAGLPEPDVQAALDPGGAVTLQWKTAAPVQLWADHFGMTAADVVVFGPARKKHTVATGLAGDATTPLRFAAVEEVSW